MGYRHIDAAQAYGMNAALDFTISDKDMDGLKRLDSISDHGAHSFFSVFGGKLEKGPNMSETMEPTIGAGAPVDVRAATRHRCPFP